MSCWHISACSAWGNPPLTLCMKWTMIRIFIKPHLASAMASLLRRLYASALTWLAVPSVSGFWTRTSGCWNPTASCPQSSPAGMSRSTWTSRLSTTRIPARRACPGLIKAATATPPCSPILAARATLPTWSWGRENSTARKAHPGFWMRPSTYAASWRMSPCSSGSTPATTLPRTSGSSWRGGVISSSSATYARKAKRTGCRWQKTTPRTLPIPGMAKLSISGATGRRSYTRQGMAPQSMP